MQITSDISYNKETTKIDKGDIPNSKNSDSSTQKTSNTKDSFQKELYSKDSSLIECYNSQGVAYALNTTKASNVSSIDKGTAISTTVYVNRTAYDKILNATTFGDVKWEEMGVDDEKRWVVVNGQRFECEHSPEEKALRKRMQKSLVDLLDENYKNRNSKAKVNGDGNPRGNIEALKSNKEVMNLLQNIFNESTPEGVLSQLA